MEDALFDIPIDNDEILWPETGSDFMEFELLSLLGVGAAARVFLARQRNLGNRFVALKVSRFGGSEAEILGKLQHPHVVPIFSVHFEPEQSLTAVCMPYLGGATLRDIGLRAFQDGRPAKSVDVILEAARNCHQSGEFVRGEAPAHPRLLEGSYVDGIVHMMAELADGLAYTHDHQVMHRDLKPSNVLVTPQGRPMLLDFNLSSDAELEVSRMGGTLPYMPSEQIYATFFAEQPLEENDPRADIFSLGVILYELLTGHLPFPTSNSTAIESLHELLAAHSAGVPDIRERNPDVSPELAELIESCLDPVSDMRPPTAADLAAQLRGLLPLTPVANPQPEVQVHRRRGLWQNIRTTSLVLAVATPLSFVGAQGWDWKPNQPPPAERSDLSEVSGRSEGSASPKTRAALLLAARDQAEANGDFHRVLELLEEAEQLSPGDSLVPHRAYCHFRLGELDRTIQLLARELDQHSHDADLWNNLGYCYLKQGDTFAAKQHLDRALAEEPDHVRANLNRALCNFVLAERGYADPDYGVAFAERALEMELNPDPLALLAAARLHALRAKYLSAGEISPRELRVERKHSVARIQEHLEVAVHFGLPADQLRQSKELEPLSIHPWFDELVQVAEGNGPLETGDVARAASYAVPQNWE